MFELKEINIVNDRPAYNVNYNGLRYAEKLIQATERDDINAIQDCIAHGVDIKNAYDKQLLHFAIRLGSFTVVKYLSDKVDLKQIDLDGNSVLDTALLYQKHYNPEIPLYLINSCKISVNPIIQEVLQGNLEALRGRYLANENLAEISGYSMMHYAAARGLLGEVTWIANNFRALIDQTNNVLEVSPLMVAAANGQEEIIKYLLAQGAAVNKRDKNGENALIYAIKNNYPGAAKILFIHHPDMQSDPKYQRTPLLWAVFAGDLEMLKFLLEKGAKLSDRDLDGNTPILCAAIGGQVEIIYYLMDAHHMTLTECNNFGMTALLCAAASGKHLTVDWLLRHGSSIAEKDAEGNNAVCIAIKNNRLAIVELLKARGAAFANCNKYGDNTFIYSARVGKLDILRELFIPAQIEEQNSNNDTALICAINGGYVDVVEWLLEHDANVKTQNTDGNTPFLCAVKKGDIRIFDLFLNNKELLNCLSDEDNDGNNALMLSLVLSNSDIFLKLLDKCSPQLIKKKNKNGESIFLYAAKMGRLEILQKLWQENHDSLKDKNKEGSDALILAAENGHLPIVQWLSDLNYTDTSEENYNGFTAIESALQSKHQDVTVYLQQQYLAKMHIGDGVDKKNILMERKIDTDVAELKQSSQELKDNDFQQGVEFFKIPKKVLVRGVVKYLEREDIESLGATCRYLQKIVLQSRSDIEIIERRIELIKKLITVFYEYDKANIGELTHNYEPEDCIKKYASRLLAFAIFFGGMYLLGVYIPGNSAVWYFLIILLIVGACLAEISRVTVVACCCPPTFENLRQISGNMNEEHFLSLERNINELLRSHELKINNWQTVAIWTLENELKTIIIRAFDHMLKVVKRMEDNEPNNDCKKSLIDFLIVDFLIDVADVHVDGLESRVAAKYFRENAIIYLIKIALLLPKIECFDLFYQIKSILCKGKIHVPFLFHSSDEYNFDSDFIKQQLQVIHKHEKSFLKPAEHKQITNNISESLIEEENKPLLNAVI